MKHTLQIFDSEHKEFIHLELTYNGQNIDTKITKTQKLDIQKPLENAQPKKCSTCSQKIKGAIGLAKTALNIDNAEDETVSKRWLLCSVCNKNTSGICSECYCHISAKIRQKTEECPLKYW